MAFVARFCFGSSLCQRCLSLFCLHPKKGHETTAAAWNGTMIATVHTQAEHLACVKCKKSGPSSKAAANPRRFPYSFPPPHAPLFFHTLFCLRLAQANLLQLLFALFYRARVVSIRRLKEVIMSQSTNNIPISGRQEKQGTPIPINVTSVPRTNAYQAGNAGQSRQDESASGYHLGSELAGSQLGMTGIEAPPNSLVTPSLMSSHLGGNAGGSSTAQMIGGWNPPPNTPAQASKLQQVMGSSSSSGLGSSQAYGAGQVPTGSFIDRKLHGMEHVREADEDEMDQDMDDFSPDGSNPSSYQPNTHHLSNKDPDDMFEMEQ